MIQRLLFPRWIAFFLIICLYPAAPLLPQNTTQNTIDTLLEKARLYKADDTTKVDIYNDITSEYCRIDPVKGIDYGLKGLSLAEKLKSNNQIAGMCHALGSCYFAQSDYTEALNYYFRAVAINEKTGNKNNLAKNYSNIGLVYQNQSDYPLALEYYFKALRINEELGNEKGKANKLNNIGLVYQKQKDYQKALEYFNGALEINNRLNNDPGRALNIGNIGNIYCMMKEYSKSLDCHTKAMIIDEALGDKRGLAADLGNIGDVLTLMGDYEQAERYQKQALVIRQEINNQRGMMYSFGGLADIYFKQATDTSSHEGIRKINLSPGQKNDLLNKAIEFAGIAVTIGNNIHSKLETSDWYSILAKSYRELGNWKMSLMYSDSFHTVKDTIFSEQTRIKMANLDHQRYREVKEKEIEVLKVKDKHKKIAIFAISGGFLSLLLISLLIYRNLIHKKRTNRILEHQNLLIVSQKDQLESNNELMQHEIRLAAEYVQSLLPHRLSQGPVITDYLFYPSSVLGGDSFGYHWIDKDHFAMYILDVCGHGIGAALHSISALNMIRSGQNLKVDPRNPSAVANALNSAFRMEDHGDLFFSLWYGVISFRNGEPDQTRLSLSYVCAGHPSPVLISPDGSIKELGPASLTIGCVPAYEYHDSELLLDQGSFLFLFSDGAYEIAREEDRMMSLEEFYQLVTDIRNKQEFGIHQVFEEVQNINTQTVFADDVSLVGIKV